MALQLIPQTPDAQLAVPLVVLHAFGHEPQCSGSVLRFTSQPFATLLSQLENPLLQAMAQAPAAQEAVPLVELQVPPQPPQ